MSVRSTKKGRPRRPIRDEILELAEVAFFERGIRAVSIEELAGQINTSKSAFYRQFTNKHALVKAVMERMNGRINDEIGAIVVGGEPFPDKLGRIARYTSRLLERVSDSFFQDLRESMPDLWRQYLKSREQRVKTLYGGLFERGREEGHLRRDVPVPVVTLIYLQLTELVVDSESLAVFRDAGVDPYDVVQSVFLSGLQRSSEAKDQGGLRRT